VNAVPYRSAVTIGDGSQLYSTHKGSIQVTDSIKVDNALYVPGLACNLLSVRELFSDKMNIRFTKDEAVILDEKRQSILGTAAFERQNGTYTLRASPSIPSAMLATSTDYVLNWHNRLGHLHFGEVVKLGKAGWLEKDWESKYTFANVNSDEYICEPCILGKGARQASHRNDERRKGHVHIDLWGAARTPTINGARYMLTCHDDYSRRTQIFFLKKKSDALAAFADYIKLVENHCQTTIKTVRSNNGGEFTSTRFAALLTRNAIEAMPIPADAHAQNGRVERQHLTIFNTVRTLLIHSGLPDKFWGEAASYAVHLRNHLPLSNSGETPMSLWTGKPSRPLSSFEPFGSPVYVRDYTQSNKLKPRYVKAPEKEPRNDSIIANNSENDPVKSPVQSPRYQQSELEEDDVDAQLFQSSEEHSPQPVSSSESTKPVNTFVKPKPRDRKGVTYETVAVDEDHDPHNELIQLVPTSFINEDGRRVLTRNRKGLKATTNESNEVLEEVVTTFTRVALLARADTQTPQTYLQARKSGEWPEWQIAIIEELRKMDKYDVWEVVTQTKDMRVLSAKWVFMRKIDGSTGLPSTFKASLGCQRFSPD
jgi:hypothetical protein